MNTRTSTATRRRTPARRTPARRTPARRTPARKPARVEVIKLSDVNPRVRSTAMHAASGDAKRIKVISKTEVVVT